MGHFRQLLWRNRLDIARSTTTVSGRLYGVGRIILVYNAYAVTIFWLYFLVFGLFQPLYWLYRLEIVRCICLGCGLYDGIGSLYVTREKQIWLFLAKNCFQFLAYFRQLFWRNRLDIARCKTTGSGRLYGVERIVLVCNA